MDKEIAKAKIERRSAKATFTRYGNCLKELFNNDETSVDYLTEYFNKFNDSFNNLVIKQDAYCALLDDDEFTNEESLFQESYKIHLGMSTQFNSLKNIPTPQGVLTKEESFKDSHKDKSNTASSSLLKMEKVKMPTFNGDIREYFIFKEDFLYMVNKNYSDRDCMTLLRACLVGKPLELIKGIGNEYSYAWSYLDNFYGDPRLVADTICQDINRFKNLREDEDHKFCEFVQLIQRSYNIMKSVGRPNDMDNNHMLAVIEQKLTIDDRKVWARELEHKSQAATFENLLTWLMVEMKARMRATAQIRHSGGKLPVNQVSVEGDVDSNSYAKNFKCWMCKCDDHWVEQCNSFKDLTIDERFSKAKDNFACFCCLKKASKNHRSSNCNSRTQCKENYNGERCKLFHHILLHKNSTDAVTVASMKKCQSFMPVLKVELFNSNSKSLSTNLLFDSASHISLIKDSVAKELKLKGKPITLNIIKVGGSEEVLDTYLYNINIKSMINESVHNLTVVGMPRITETFSNADVNYIASCFKLKPQELLFGHGEIDILVGIDHAYMHSGEVLNSGDMVARKSPLGWVVLGGNSSNLNMNSVLNITLKDMNQFWSTESMGVNKKECSCQAENLEQNALFELKEIENLCTKVGNQWMISYPWKNKEVVVPNNKNQAMKRLESLEKRLLNDEFKAKAYAQIINEMEANGFCRKLSHDEMELYKGNIYYISHHAVLTPQKKSTPVRIVFNSSEVYKGFCLNECWLKGPNLFNDLCGILMRFREQPVAICGDISKMYHRISIPVEEQHVHRFLWRALELNRVPDTYVKTVLTFGDKPAPAMAQIVLQKTATEFESDYPLECNIIKKNSYMDDICHSLDSKELAEAVMKNIDFILRSGGFTVKEWISNVFDYDENAVEKVLGIQWWLSEDFLSINYDTNLPGLMKPCKLSKRIILSKVSKIYDPLGLVAPFTIRAKIGIQELWLASLEWDDKVSDNVTELWLKFFDELGKLGGVKFKRCTKPPNAVGKPMLCLFCDASEKAFGACAYIRWLLSDNTYFVSLLLAKSRVAPLKLLTIPRLELQGAVLAARLSKTIIDQSCYKFEKVIYFTDSMIVISWLANSARNLKPFVAARIGEIHSISEPSQWRHLSREYNIADYITHGVTIEKLVGEWSNGPNFLYGEEIFWPRLRAEIPMEEVNKERKIIVAVMSSNEPLIQFEKFSKWRRLLRTTAYMLVFIQMTKKENGYLEDTVLTPTALKDAEKCLIKLVQLSLWKQFENNDYKSLSPFVGEDNIIRVGGRVRKSEFSYDIKHPVLLPFKHKVSFLIVKHVHETGHYGVATTAAKVRKNYWILRVHDIAKLVKKQCVCCKKFNVITENQFMSDMPDLRLKPFTPPFLYTSTDYFGPYTVRILRNRSDKYYGVIFTCLNSRAVHLEIATDCATAGLLAVLRRFWAIRGFPYLMLSDNGTQYVGAEKELKQMIQSYDKKLLINECANNQITWKFTTPAAPHHNGVTESLVKSVKAGIKKAIGDQILKPFELLTVFTEVANIVNERPIGRIPNDPDDGSYICPNDLLLGRASSHIPQGPFNEGSNLHQRFQLVQNIIDSFWKKWFRDIFPTLIPRRKWHINRRNVAVGDIVVLGDTNIIRSKWTLGRIVETFPGSDNKVRTVKVRTSDNDYLRPISKIAVIYPVEGYNDNETFGGSEDVLLDKS